MVHAMSEVEKYSELKLVAGKATPGPWWVDSHGMNMTSLPNLDLVFSHPANGEAVRNAETGNLSHWRNDWDASYIATANPKTILELISDFDAQRLRADTAEAELKLIRDALGIDPRHHVGKTTADGIKDLADAYVRAGEKEHELRQEIRLWKDRTTNLTHKLAAAEQRIADLSQLLFYASERLSKVRYVGLHKRIRAALNQKSEGESQ